MIINAKRTRALALCTFVGLALLVCSQLSATDERWSVISLPPKPTDMVSPVAVVVDTAGNLYVADQGHGLQKRDAQGKWSVITTYGSASGQVRWPPTLAVDAAGNLYVADSTGSDSGRIQKRDPQGRWSFVATAGDALGQVSWPGSPTPLAVDAAGNL
jgi:sugar lactone lactonase YvrE